MNDAGGVVLSVRAEARRLVAPDSAVLDALIEQTAGSRREAVESAAASLGGLTAELAALGGVAFDEQVAESPLTWSAHSSAIHEERYPDKDTGRQVRTGQVTATVALRVTIRDLGILNRVSGVFADRPGLTLHGVTWHVDWDNAAWPQVRATAIQAAIRKAADYAAALGASVERVEHIADAGLLGGDETATLRPVRFTARAMSGSGEGPGTPELTPVPQELIATIEARFTTTAVSLPGSL
jgi:uncharacterized protein YggE